MSEKRGFWFLLTGLVIGSALGLLIAWVISPIQYVDTSPASLRTDFKDDYRFMIASAYSASGDLPRAEARLATLADPDQVKAMGQQAQRMLANNTSMELVQVIADLSLAVQNRSAQSEPTAGQTGQVTATALNPASATPIEFSAASPVASFTPIFTPTAGVTIEPTLENTASPVPMPINTIAPRPARTATPTPSAAFKLSAQNTFCDPDQPGLMQIFLSDGDGKPAAGIELVITWSGGEEHFFTGLKPEISSGYADYTMSGNIEYALTLAASGTRVTGLISTSCTDATGEAYPGGLRLDFKQP